MDEWQSGRAEGSGADPVVHYSAPPLVPPSMPVAEAGPVAWPPFGERLQALLQRPREALAGAAQQIDWVRPAIIILCGMLLYYAPTAYRTGLVQNGAMQQIVRQEQQRTQRQRPAPNVSPPAPMPPFLNSFFNGIGAFTAFAGLLNVLWYAAGSWFARTAVFYALGRAFRGLPRSFFPLFAAVGWAWFPLLIQFTLVGLAFAFVPGFMQFFVPLPTDMQSPTNTMQAMGQSWHMLLLQFGTPFVWWNWYYCTMAVETSMELPRWKAMLVVAIQVLVHAAYAGATYFALSAWVNVMRNMSTAPR
jgi:hypothetical protein